MSKKVTGLAKSLHLAYSLGAAVVIIGALFKITHFELGPLTGNVVLAIGLLTEAVIFTLAAFLDIPNEEYAWEKVYPELKENGVQKARPVQKELDDKIDSALSSKLDKLLAEAKIDVNLLNNLKTGLDDFSRNIADIHKVTEAIKSTQSYTDQLTTAASHMESLNALYNIQLQHGKDHSDTTKNLVDNLKSAGTESENLVKDFSSLSTNIKELNKVYGGMLSAMRTKD